MKGLLEIKYKFLMIYRQGSQNHLIKTLNEMKTHMITELIGRVGQKSYTNPHQTRMISYSNICSPLSF